MTYINTTQDEDVLLESLKTIGMLPDWMHGMIKRMDLEIESLRDDLEKANDKAY